MRKALLTIAAVASLATGGVARAQGGVNQHDGFALQLDLGVGAMGSKATFSGSDWELSGTAGQFSIMAGGVVIPDLIIGGRLWNAWVSSPDFKIGGQKVATVGGVTQRLTGIGLDITYYFMPINIYVSATPSIGILSVESGGSSGSTKNGFAFRLAAGKEWWVSDNWGVGFNVQFAHSSNEDQGTNPPTWATNWFGVAFSATYN